MGPWWPSPSRKSPCTTPHPQSESHCQMWVVFQSSETGMRAVGQWGWGVGRGCPVALQLALCMPSPLRKEGREGQSHLPLLPQQGSGLLLCCFWYSCLWGHLISLPTTPQHVVSLGCPWKDNQKASVREIPYHLFPKALHHTPGGLLLCVSVLPRPLGCPALRKVIYYGTTPQWHPVSNGNGYR